jgi:hypothetical protein
MYRTCLFCEKPLGANAVLEGFPVGRRVAFDAARGRLWAVCRNCERWNLSPLETRWEAIEDCERIFAGTRMRVSSENVGLARHPEGLELVRIGSPQRPEFAAWRYGDQFGRRRRRAILYGVGASAVLGGLVVGGLAAGVISGSVLAQSGNFINLWQNGRVLLKVPLPEGGVMKLKRPELVGARIAVPERDGGLEVTVGSKKRQRVFRGEDAQRVASAILPRVNATGARLATVQQAVRAIETAGGPEPFLVQAAAEAKRGARSSWKSVPAGAVHHLAVPSRLALEMVLHEEQERRALLGELKALEIAWQSAEEVAAIADDLLLPEGVHEFLVRNRSVDREAADGTASPPA